MSDLISRSNHRWDRWALLGLTILINVLIEPAFADAPLTLVPKKATWRYLDDGTDQLNAWRESAFDDSAWLEGKAELGFGDGGEATKLKPGPSNNRTITFYFRHRFQVPADVLRDYHFLTLELLVDDGAVVYLNGTPVATVNLVEEPFYDELAEKTIWDTIEGRPTLHRESLDVLKPGENVIAVEVHQAEVEGVDISFDLRLSSERASYSLPIPVSRFEDGMFLAGRFGAEGQRSLILSRNPEFAEPVFQFEPDESGSVRVRVASPVDFRAAIADFNGDGIDELVYGSSEPTTGAGQEVLLQSFDPASGTSIAKRLPVTDRGGNLSCSAGERDGDGRLDLFVMAHSARSSARIYCLRQTGNLEFAEPELVAEVPSPWGQETRTGILAGDFDGDGRADLILYGPGRVFLLRQGADGSYGEAVPVQIDMDEVMMTHGFFVPNRGKSPDVALRALVDLNGNGRGDLVLSHGFHLGNSTGRLSTVRGIAAAGVIVAVHDYDLDGDVDLLATNNQGTGLYWFLNSGRAEFSNSVFVTPVSRVMTAGVVGDVNGDGLVDLLVNDVDMGTFLVMRQVPGVPVVERFDVLSAATEWEFSDEVTVTWSIRDADAVTISPLPGPVAASGSVTMTLAESTSFLLHAKNATGEATVERRVSIPVFRDVSRHDLLPPAASGSDRHTTAGDLNGDGVLDVVWDAGSALMAGYRGSDLSTFSAKQIATLPRTFPGEIRISDFDSDGRADVLVSSRGVWHLVRQNPDETFVPLTPIPVVGTAAGVINHGLVDIDGDGDLDYYGVRQGIVFQRNDAGELAELQLLFEWSADQSSGMDVNQSPVWLDADGDGDLDIAGFDSQGVVLVFLQNLQQQGEISYLLRGFLRYGKLVAADYDGDGDQDLMMSKYSGTQNDDIIVFENTGSGLSSSPELLAIGAAPNVSADVDGDGLPDLLDAFSGAWLRQLSNGKFVREPGFPPSISAGFNSIARDTAFGDGDLDAFKFGRNDVNSLDAGQVGFWVENFSAHSAEGTPSLAIDDVTVDAAGLVLRWRDLAAGGNYQIETSGDLLVWTPLLADAFVLERVGGEVLANVPFLSIDGSARVFYLRVRRIAP
ncbi:MAG: VCBS repeat-containing protein [Verrucomicrobiales bacterium]